MKELRAKTEALPAILARLDGVASSLREVTTLMRNQATTQAEILHLKESDREQWTKLNAMPDMKDMKKKLDIMTSSPGRWLHTVSSSLVGGVVVGLVMKFSGG
jgi:hypothetical protein